MLRSASLVLPAFVLVAVGARFRLLGHPLLVVADWVEAELRLLLLLLLLAALVLFWRGLEIVVLLLERRWLGAV